MWLLTCSVASYASTSYKVYVKPPICEGQDYKPAIVGDFTSWRDNLAMEYVLEGQYAGWYYYAFDESVVGRDMKIRELNDYNWQNEILCRNGGMQEIADGWYTMENIKFTRGEYILALDFSEVEQYCWQQCMPEPVADYLTQTDMPVLYIRTQNGAKVDSKDYYVTGYYYLDNRGIAGIESIASETAPDTLQIKGRGNWTWSAFDKKPYRLKLNKKTALLGLKKSKHFGLLAHADDRFAWMRNTMGFLLSEQMELAWTPQQQPVEVVLNGDYIGLYMLTELIRVDKNRVNIVEQADLCTHPDSITGGWLVEIDNYREDGNIEFQEPAFEPYHGARTAMFTPKSPEVLSNAQRTYLTTQLQGLQDAIYSNSDTRMKERIDMESLAKFYLVQEIMSNCESFNGSCYLYKDMGENEHWHWGPVWDFGNSYDRNNEQMIYEGESMFAQKWIARMLQHPVLQTELQRQWDHWRYYHASEVKPVIMTLAERIAAAAARDAKRWPQYNHSDAVKRARNICDNYDWRVNMLSKLWGEGCADPVTQDAAEVATETRPIKILRNGQVMIQREGVVYNLLGY